MSDPFPLKEVLPSQSFPEPQPERPLIEEAEEALTDATPKVETNPASPLAVETDEPVVESRIRKVCKTMCVTTASSLMVISWAFASMFFSGVAGYWLLATMPFLRSFDFLVRFYYPTTSALAVVLFLSPVFAVIGDLRCGNYRMLLAGVIPLNVIGLAVTAGVLVGVAFVEEKLVLLNVAVVGYILLYLAIGIFQTNAIQYGRDVLGDSKSPELSAFVHWYYWALHVPLFFVGVPMSVGFLFSEEGSLILSTVILIIIFLAAFLTVVVVTFLIHCLRWPLGKVVPEQRIKRNPATLVCRVTQHALQHPAGPGHGGLLARLNNSRQSNGGPADDEEVDSVAKFWLLLLLMVSLFGFVFWDDMWAVSLVNALIQGPVDIDYAIYPSNYFTSSQLTTSAVIVVCVPVYQLIIRPFMGKRSFPPHLWRIWIGLILELISLAVVTWSSAVTTSRIGPEALSNVSDYICGNQERVDLDAENFQWEILLIPQVINGLSQLLVFPAVIELILTDAPRVMHGLLIGLWYTLQSIHLIVGIIEAATCAVLYWQYYLMKIAFVLLSIVSFGASALYYKHKQVMRRDHITLMDDQDEVVAQSQDAL